MSDPSDFDTEYVDRQMEGAFRSDEWVPRMHRSEMTGQPTGMIELRRNPVPEVAARFLAAYRAASGADEEGLASRDDWRAAWGACDRAADELELALSETMRR